MSTKKSERPGHQDAIAVRRVVAYLEKLGRLDPLQSAVGADIAAILDEALTTGAVIRTRIKNLGTPGVMSKPVMRRSDDAWTEAMDEQLRVRYYERGQSFVQIAEAMGRTDESCRSRARRLGWEPSYELTRWTDAEDAALAALVKAKVGPKRIAAEVGRSLQAVYHRMDHLRLAGVLTEERTHRPYTVEELDALREHWQAGKRIREIAVALGRSESSVREQVKRIGLSGTRTPPLPVYNTRPYRNLTAIGRVAERRKLAREEAFARDRGDRYAANASSLAERREA
jgi:biotin operon repressor